MAKSTITPQQAQALFEKWDNGNESIAENAFKELRQAFVDNGLRFSDWIDTQKDMPRLKGEFDSATTRNTALKQRRKTLEQKYAALKAELASI